MEGVSWYISGCNDYGQFFRKLRGCIILLIDLSNCTTSLRIEKHLSTSSNHGLGSTGENSAARPIVMDQNFTFS